MTDRPPQRTPNRQLAALIAEAGFSNAGLARRVDQLGLEHGLDLRYDKTSVTRWLRGQQPRGTTPALIAEVFTRRLGRRLSAQDLGLDACAPVYAGLEFASTPEEAVDIVSGLWRKDSGSHAELRKIAFTPAGLVVPSRDWLIGRADERVGRTDPPPGPGTGRVPAQGRGPASGGGSSGASAGESPDAGGATGTGAAAVPAGAPGRGVGGMGGGAGGAAGRSGAGRLDGPGGHGESTTGTGGAGGAARPDERDGHGGLSGSADDGDLAGAGGHEGPGTGPAGQGEPGGPSGLGAPGGPGGGGRPAGSDGPGGAAGRGDSGEPGGAGDLGGSAGRGGAGVSGGAGESGGSGGPGGAGRPAGRGGAGVSGGAAGPGGAGGSGEPGASGASGAQGRTGGPGLQGRAGGTGASGLYGGPGGQAGGAGRHDGPGGAGTAGGQGGPGGSALPGMRGGPGGQGGPAGGGRPGGPGLPGRPGGPGAAGHGGVGGVRGHGGPGPRVPGRSGGIGAQGRPGGATAQGGHAHGVPGQAGPGGPGHGAAPGQPGHRTPGGPGQGSGRVGQSVHPAGHGHPSAHSPGAAVAAAAGLAVPRQRGTERGPGQRVTGGDIAALRSVGELFRTLDHAYGGGHARQALVRYLEHEAEPMLRGTYGENLGRRLFGAAADLTRLAGWTSYDIAAHGLAQRYFVQALRLSQAAGDRAYGSYVLLTMSRQAVYLGHGREAVQLARVAQQGIGPSAPPAVQALLHAVEARGHAVLGEVRACTSSLVRAERSLDAARPGDEVPHWARPFDEAQLADEFAHCHRDLQQYRAAAQHAERALRLYAPGFARSRTFCRVVLAASRLGLGELDQACSLGAEAAQQASEMRSARAAEYVRDFERRLEPYREAAAVRTYRDKVSVLG